MNQTIGAVAGNELVMPPELAVSIIICTRNRCQALAETLKSLETVVVPEGMRTEVLVVDNGSTDGTQSLVASTRLSRMEIKYVCEPEAGLSNARNKGIEAAHGNVIVFTDDDVKPESEWLKRITQPIVDDRFDAVAGQVCIAPHLMRPWMTDWHRGWLASTHYLDQKNPEFAVGANMAFSRRVLEQVPHFDPELGAGRLGCWEETLFFFQLKRAGYRIGMAADAIVEHHFDVSRLSRNSFLARAIDQGRSQAYVTWHWKHEDRAFPLLRAARRELELFAKRMFRSQECQQTEGMPVWEMQLVTWIAFLCHFKKVRREPRAYEQYGTRKLHPSK